MPPSRSSARIRGSATGFCSTRPRRLAQRFPGSRRCAGCPAWRVAVDADGTVTVGGVRLGRAKTHALDGRPLTAIAAGTIPPGHYFLHADHRDSHDSRYAEIGLVPRARILGRAVALPDLPWLGLQGPLVGPEEADPGGGSATVLPWPAPGAAPGAAP